MTLATTLPETTLPADTPFEVPAGSMFFLGALAAGCSAQQEHWQSRFFDLYQHMLATSSIWERIKLRWFFSYFSQKSFHHLKQEYERNRMEFLLQRADKMLLGRLEYGELSAYLQMVEEQELSKYVTFTEQEANQFLQVYHRNSRILLRSQWLHRILPRCVFWIGVVACLWIVASFMSRNTSLTLSEGIEAWWIFLRSLW